MKPVWARITAFLVLEAYLLLLTPPLILRAESPAPPEPRQGCLETLVTPEIGGELVLGKIRLTVPPGAVGESFLVRMELLAETEPLAAGVRNLTGTGGGFRFLPDGTVFRKPVLVTLPCTDPGAAGATVWYYNPASKVWLPLEKVSADPENGTVTCLTTHFTDMVTAVLEAPETAGPHTLAPDAVSRLAAGDPSAGVPGLRYSGPDSGGALRFDIPLALPAGRGSATPQLALRYGSDGSGGDAGWGFDLPVSSIGIDTRFGVPCYDGTERYLLDGGELVPLWGGEYGLRREGRFCRVIRSGDGPGRWLFEVRDNDGSRSFYGHGFGGREEAVVSDPAGQRRSGWMLTRYSDRNGNTVDYAWLKNGGELYLSSMSWSGHPETGTTALYTARLDWESRPDRRIDARMGYPLTRGLRLARVTTFFDGLPIRSWFCEYRVDLFGQSRLAAFGERSPAGAEAWRYRFDWKEPPLFKDGLAGFLPTEAFGGRSGSLGTEETFTGSGSLYLGIGWGFVASVGISAGFDASLSRARAMLIDLDGDGLSDELLTGLDGKPSWRRNNGQGFDPRRNLPDLPDQLNRGESDNYQFSISGSLGPLNASGGVGFGFSCQKSQFTDVEGDGFPDFVSTRDGGAWYWACSETGYEPRAWSTGGSWRELLENDLAGAGEPGHGNLVDLKGAYSCLDTVLEWVPYRSGTVMVAGSGTKTDRGGDGVFLAGQWNDAEGEGKLLTDDDPRLVFNSEVPVTFSRPLRFRSSAVEGIAGDAVRADILIDYKEIRIHEFMGEFVFNVLPVNDMFGTWEPVKYDRALTGKDRESSGELSPLYYKQPNRDLYVFEQPEIGSMEDAGRFHYLVKNSGTRIGYRNPADGKGYTVTEAGNRFYIDLHEHDLPMEGAALWLETEAWPLEAGVTVAGKGVLCEILQPADGETVLYWLNDLSGSVDLTAGQGGLTLKTIMPDNRGYYDLGTLILVPEVSTEGNPWKRIPVELFPVEAPFNAPDHIAAATAESSLFPAMNNGEQLLFGTYYTAETDTEGRVTGYRLTCDPDPDIDDLLKKTGLVSCYLRDGDSFVPEDVPDLWLVRFARLYGLSYPVLENRECRVYSDTLYAVEDFAGTVQGTVLPVNGNDTVEPGNTGRGVRLTGSDNGRLREVMLPLHRFSAAGDFSLTDLTGCGTPDASDWAGEESSNPPGGPSDVSAADRAAIEEARRNGAPVSRPGGSYNWYYSFSGRGFENQPMLPLGHEAAGIIDEKTGFDKNPWGRDLWYGARFDMKEEDFSAGGEPLCRPVSHAVRIEAADGALWFQPSRLCGEAAGKIPGDSENLTNSGLPVINRSRQQSWFVSGGISAGIGPISAGMSVLYSESKQITTRSFLDINGDRYPDQLVYPEAGGDPMVIPGNGGGFGPGNRWYGGFGSFRESRTGITSAGGSLGLATGSRPAPAMRGSGKVTHIKIPAPTWGVGANLAEFSSKEVVGFSDLNGDGLPDHLKITDSAFDLRLNNGTGFEPFSGGFPKPAGRDCLSDSKGSTASFSFGASYIAGISAGVSASVSRTTEAFIDMNGDGLADSVTKNRNDPWFLVSFNDGDSFGAPIKWYTPDWEIGTDGFDIDLSVAGAVTNILSEIFPGERLPAGDPGLSPGKLVDYDVAGTGDVLRATAELGCTVGLNATIRIPLPFFLTFYITPGGGVAFSRTSASLDIADLDGDGLPDHVCQGAGETFYRLKRNALGTTGTLERITLPQGGTLTFGWEILPPTKQCPFAQTVLSSVSVNDGFADRPDRGDHHTVTETYRYEGGYYDRSERAFYGCRKVTRSTAGGQTRVTLYHNDLWYCYGLPESEKILDTDGDVFVATSYTRERQPGSGGSVFYPVTAETVTHTDLETGEQLSVNHRYGYDRYGNLIKVTDRETVTDIVWQYGTAEIPWLTSLPVAVTVSGGGRVLRNRNARYDGRGNRTTLRIPFGGDELLYETVYDPLGNPIRSVDPAGYAVELEYDGETRSRPVRVTDSFGLVSTTRYDNRFGLPVETVDPSGNSMRTGYDDHGRVSALWSPCDRWPEKPSLKFTYRRDVIPWQTRVENKVRLDPEDDESFSLISWADGLGRVVQTAAPCTVYDPDTRTRTGGWRYSGIVFKDRAGRPELTGRTFFIAGDTPLYPRLRVPDSPVTTLYDTRGIPMGQRLPDGSVYRKTEAVTEEGFVTVTEDPEGRQVRLLTDDRGLVTERTTGTGPGALTVRQGYDPLGQLTTITRPGGSVVTFAYDTLGHLTERVTPETGTTRWGYDNRGRLATTADARLLARGTAIRYSYEYNRLTAIDYPESPDTFYRYAPAGAEGNQAGRLAETTDASGRVRFTYGRLGEVTAREVTLNRLTGNTLDQPITLEFRYLYDYLGRLETMTYPDGETLRYAYDRGGQAVSVTGEKWGRLFTYAGEIGYNAEGSCNFIKYGNGTETVYRYNDDRLWLEGQTTRLKSGRILQNLTMAHDRAGNVLKVEDRTPDRDLEQSFSYDALGRLTRADGRYTHHPLTTLPRDFSYSQQFLYNPTGTLSVKTLTLTDSQTRSGEPLNRDILFDYDPARPHRMVQAGPLSITHDEAGHLVREQEPGGETDGTGLPTEAAGEALYDPGTDTWHLNHTAGWGLESGGYEAADSGDATRRTDYRYDEEGRLTTTVVKGRTTAYRYGAQGLRAGKFVDTAETLTPDPGYQVMIEHTPATIAKHIFVSGRRIATKLSLDTPYPSAGFETDNTFWFHPDPLGSTRYLTDADGGEFEHRETLPFGEPWIEERQYAGLPPTAVLFTGQETDPETGLVCFPARYYSPALSGWLSSDPAMDGLNWYQYCAGNPVGMVDPWGMDNFFINYHRSTGKMFYTYVYTNQDGTLDRDRMPVTGVFQFHNTVTETRRFVKSPGGYYYKPQQFPDSPAEGWALTGSGENSLLGKYVATNANVDLMSYVMYGINQYEIVGGQAYPKDSSGTLSDTPFESGTWEEWTSTCAPMDGQDTQGKHLFVQNGEVNDDGYFIHEGAVGWGCLLTEDDVSHMKTLQQYFHAAVNSGDANIQTRGFIFNE
jgi:RHS repeat-associated protein